MHLPLSLPQDGAVEKPDIATDTTEVPGCLGPADDLERSRNRGGGTGAVNRPGLAVRGHQQAQAPCISVTDNKVCARLGDLDRRVPRILARRRPVPGRCGKWISKLPKRRQSPEKLGYRG